MPNPDRSPDLRLYCRGIIAFDCEQWQLAIDLLINALPGLHSYESRNEFTEAHYCLALAYENLGNPEKAKQHYCEVLAVDYEYKDALERIERILPQ